MRFGKMKLTADLTSVFCSGLLSSRKKIVNKWRDNGDRPCKKFCSKGLELWLNMRKEWE